MERDGVFIYLDRYLVAHFEPRAEYLNPKAVLLKLAAVGGWSITGMADPSVIKIDYVRAYQLAP